MTLMEISHDALVVMGSAVGGYVGQHISIRRIRAAVAAAARELRVALEDLRARVVALERAIDPQEDSNHGG